MNVIVLAAGEGKRFHANTAKVLVSLQGRPMIAHLMGAITEARVARRPVVVVGYDAVRVQATIGDRCEYVVQEQQLGTGHAVACCRALLEERPGPTLVLYGDMPLVRARTIKRLVATHLTSQPTITMATVTVPDFLDWRRSLASFGRVVRSDGGHVERIVEVRDATPEEASILEVSPSYFCFDGAWLWTNIGRLRPSNAQHEFYLTDLVAFAITSGKAVRTVPVPPPEALGANTAEELAIISELVGRPAE